jgi:hypothetical protein
MSDIDPVHYGAITAEVANLRREVNDLRDDVKTLLALANKHKGGLWMGMSVASLFGAVVTFVAEHFLNKTP